MCDCLCNYDGWHFTLHEPLGYDKQNFISKTSNKNSFSPKAVLLQRGMGRNFWQVTIYFLYFTYILKNKTINFEHSFVSFQGLRHSIGLEVKDAFLVDRWYAVLLCGAGNQTANQPCILSAVAEGHAQVLVSRGHLSNAWWLEYRGFIPVKCQGDVPLPFPFSPNADWCLLQIVKSVLLK